MSRFGATMTAPVRMILMKRDILYVDDEQSNLIVFEAAFEDEFNIHTVTSAEAALKFLESRLVPVVVADQRMPEMTGVEMFALIRKIYPHTQRVILSGFSDSDAIIDAINQGQVFQFVRKPWQRIELMAVLRRALDAHDLSLQNSVLTDRMLVSERSAMLGQATGRIAHEMGNQLNLLPLIELIEDEYRDDPQLQQLADVAHQTYDRLTELIDEVKTFMKFEAEGETRLSPLNLAESLHELASFVRFNSGISSELIELDIRSEPVVAGNRLKLHQVLVNLVKNAADAIGDRADGRIRLVLDQSGDEAILRVIDNGVGIPDEVCGKIWQPFYTTKGRCGNGMGLDICRRLVELHQGSIRCESTGETTIFEIRLPLATDEPDKVVTPQPVRSGVTAAGVTGA